MVTYYSFPAAHVHTSLLKKGCQFSGMSLLKKVLLTVLIASMLTLTGLTFFGLKFVRSAVEQSSGDLQVQLARQTMLAIDRSLYGSYQQIKAVGSADTLIAVSRDSSVRARNDAVRRLQELQRDIADWNAVEVVNAAGTVLAASDASRIGQMHTAKDYQKLLGTALGGTVSYSDAFLSDVTGKPTVVFAAPLRASADPAAPVTGAVVAELDWRVVVAALQDKVDATFEVFNAAGQELGDSNTDNFDEILKNEQADNSVIKAALGGKQGSRLTTGVDDTQMALVSYVQQQGYKDYKGHQWVLIAQTPAHEVFESTDAVGRRLVGVFAVATLISIVLLMVALNRIVLRRVKRLARVTQEIAAGNLGARAHIRSRDEFGQLGQAYDRMADKLQTLYHGLEAKVQEKTNQLAERIHESEAGHARDEAILSGIGEGLVALDDKSQVVMVNDKAAEIFGLKRQDLYGKPLAKVLDTLRNALDQVMEPAARPEAQAQSTKQPVSGQYIYHRYQTDGTTLTLSIAATPVYNSGQFIGVVLMVRDMTKEKEIDRMKTEFISLASHQLRTPLSAIKWSSQMMSSDVSALSDEQRELARNIGDSTERMIQLVNSLLNISRIESGRIIIDPKPTDVRAMVTQLVHDLQPEIDAKYQQITVTIDEQLPLINLDPNLMRQVYLNLLTNAMKYSFKEGKIALTITQKGDQLVSEITDNGMGIPANQQEKVFQKFFRADNASRLETDGSGLGLYLVKAIVDSSEGTITFTSEENKGTTFRVTLPMSGMVAKDGEVALSNE
jgi:PAS domain S-box-containing protein